MIPLTLKTDTSNKSLPEMSLGLSFFKDWNIPSVDVKSGILASTETPAPLCTNHCKMHNHQTTSAARETLCHLPHTTTILRALRMALTTRSTWPAGSGEATRNAGDDGKDAVASRVRNTVIVRQMCKVEEE